VPKFGPGCCDGEVEELLGEWRIQLAEYVEFLATCRRIEAADVYNGYFLFSPLLIVRQSDAPRRLHVGTEPNLIEVNVLAIGGDGGGNMFMLGTSGPLLGNVWKWNHEFPVRFDGVALDGITKLADCFAAFLERVALDWEHFVSQDTSWDYIAG